MLLLYDCCNNKTIKPLKPTYPLFLKPFFFGLVVATFFFLNFSAIAQEENQNYQFQEKKLNSTKKGAKDNMPFVFKNVGKILYYKDAKKLKKIEEFESKKDYAKASKLLEEYVLSFGTLNFDKDTDMLWKLGQIYEKTGRVEKAKILYRMLLKHHRGDIKKVKNYYDNINSGSKTEDYVPIDYYYKLVEYRKAIDTLRPPQGVLLEMGPEVNSKFPDYGPTLNPERNILIFTSKRKKLGLTTNPVNIGQKKQVDEDLYFSYFEDGWWWDAKPFPEPINSPYNEGSACLSRDGKTLYFARCDAPGGFGNCDLYVAVMRPDSSWGDVKSLGGSINTEFWESQPSLSHNEDTLYFASDRRTGFGLSDIYFSVKLKNGTWSKAQNLGPVINSRGNEVSPFYHPKHHVLYFSSNGHPLNFGTFDIYKSDFVGKKFQEPKNIGPLVNGIGSEYYFTIDSQSEFLYYARSEDHGDIQNLNLFSFPLPMEAQPLAYTELKGTLVDSVTHQPITGIITVIDLDNGIEVAPKFLREDGSFAFDLINNNRYLIMFQGDNFLGVEEEFQLNSDTVMYFFTRVLEAEKPLVFDKIEFEEGKADILPDMFNSLNLVLKYILDHPTYKLKISGHTSSDGNPIANQKLSQARAESIKRYLIEHGGIDDGRITAEGYGDSRRLIEEDTEEAKKINRRVEFDIIK
jgi:outer membrane protein OmpA-like peptidoglycan-associated protein